MSASAWTPEEQDESDAMYGDDASGYVEEAAHALLDEAVSHDHDEDCPEHPRN